MALSNLFAGCKVYETEWKEVAVHPLTPEDVAEFTEAEVVEGEYGLSAKIYLKEGGCIFMPMDSKNSWSNVGDKLDFSKSSIVELAKEGYDNILRFRG